MRKVLSIILCLAMVLSVFTIVPFTADAGESFDPSSIVDENEPDYRYVVLDDGTAGISKYTGSGVNITLPSELGGLPVTAISGYAAFAHCETLKSVTIPEGVESIGQTAFSGCINLETIFLPKSLSSIDYSSLQGCSSLKAFMVANGNSSYSAPDGDLYNKDMTRLILHAAGKVDSSVFVLNGVTSIGNWAFGFCDNLTRITLPSSLEEIGAYAFSHCTNLREVKFNEDAESTVIGYGAFIRCDSLTNVTLYDNITAISDAAFGIMSITINNGEQEVEKVDRFTIYGNKGSEAERYAKDNEFGFIALDEEEPSDDSGFLYSLTADGKAIIEGYKGPKVEKLVIPEKLHDCPVTYIEKSAFNSNQSITEVVIPETVETIDMWAFEYCTSLKTVHIPKNTRVVERAFLNCHSLESITVDPENPYHTAVDGVLFNKDMTALHTYPAGRATDVYTVPEGVKELMNGSIYSLSNWKNHRNTENKVKEVILPDSLEKIGKWALYNSGLESLTIPKNVSEIGVSAFGHGGYAFESVNALRSIATAPDNKSFCTVDGILYTKDMKKLVFVPFDNDRHELIVPDTVEIIGENAVCVQTDNQGGALNRVVLPPSVRIIEDDAFSGCCDMKELVLSEGLESIGDRAFQSCSYISSTNRLNKVTVPKSVTHIGEQAFGFYYGEPVAVPYKVKNFDIYGYSGSEAETYAAENQFPFITLADKTDESTDISASLPEDIELKVTDITSDIIAKMPDSGELKAYDISLIKGGESVQPENIVTVKIPCDNKRAKVYRVEEDDSLTDMKAKYKDGYMVFTTDHFSVYILSEPISTGVTVSGAITSYIDDSEVTVKLVGADNDIIEETTGVNDYSFDSVPSGEYTLTVSKAGHAEREYTITVTDTDLTQAVVINPLGDVNGDGKIDVMDCSSALRGIRGLKALDEYQTKCGDVFGTGDGKIDVNDVSRILRHIRGLKTLF